MINSDDINYIIIQAGGKGSRMGNYTVNKPKCLLPVFNCPIIINFFKKYKNKKFIIIGDYLFEVLQSYLTSFCSGYDYELFQVNGNSTADGLEKAVSIIPPNEPFIISWSDLFFGEEQKFSFSKDLLIGLSKNFKCRWKYDKGFINQASSQNGIAGFFAFKNKSKFCCINTKQSFVRGFLSSSFTSKEIETFYMHNCFEVGDKEFYLKVLSESPNHRFFNEVLYKGDTVQKRCINDDYQSVHDDEKRWYKFLSGQYKNIPKITCYNPLIMDRIKGEHPWEFNKNKHTIIKNCCKAIKSLHLLNSTNNQNEDTFFTYYSKPIERISEVSSIIPLINNRTIKINKKDCINPFYELNYFKKSIASILTCKKYHLIHGDCSFSNILIDNFHQVYFIDPRGSFGSTKLYGDKRYDWAKLFYSVSTNYDSINSKNFFVNINSNHEVTLKIKSNGYEEFSDYVVRESSMSLREMLLMVSTLWLSLTGYVKEDVDSVMYSFYKGCELWNQAIYQT
jgi:hypothetical protein